MPESRVLSRLKSSAGQATLECAILLLLLIAVAELIARGLGSNLPGMIGKLIASLVHGTFLR